LLKRLFVPQWLSLISFGITVTGSVIMYRFDVTNPNVVFESLAVIFTFFGGFIPGAISGLIAIFYSLFYLSSPDTLFSYSPDNLKRLIIIIICLPAMVMFVGLLKRKLDQKNEQLEIVIEKLCLLNTLDGLTSIPNRRYFDKILLKTWMNSLQEQKSMSVLMIDIDCFKSFNDYYGHLAGDDCLRLVARQIEAAAVYPGALVAKYGGEEFVVILPNSDNHAAMTAAEEIRASIEAMRILNEHSSVSSVLTISVGVASMVPSDNFGQLDLVQRADDALYQAKNNGKNRVGVFEE